MAMCLRNCRASCLYFLLNSQCDLKVYWEKEKEQSQVQSKPTLQAEALDVLNSSYSKFHLWPEAWKGKAAYRSQILILWWPAPAEKQTADGQGLGHGTACFGGLCLASGTLLAWTPHILRHLEISQPEVTVVSRA